jgi:hypothetical protein
VQRQLELLDTAEAYKASLGADYPAEVVLSIARSDYMLDGPPSSSSGDSDAKADTDADAAEFKHSLLQIEYNTIAASFSAMAGKVAALHSFIGEKCVCFGITDTHKASEPSLAKENLAKAIAVAYARHRTAFAVPEDTRGCVILVVQPNERNYFDQSALEYELASVHHIPGMCVCVRVRVCLYICMYVCMYVCARDRGCLYFVWNTNFHSHTHPHSLTHTHSAQNDAGTGAQRHHARRTRHSGGRKRRGVQRNGRPYYCQCGVL